MNTIKNAKLSIDGDLKGPPWALPRRVVIDEAIQEDLEMRGMKGEHLRRQLSSLTRSETRVRESGESFHAKKPLPSSFHIGSECLPHATYRCTIVLVLSVKREVDFEPPLPRI